ncbi:MAG: phosphate ABC transporter permease PstA [Coriobacteriales bacterium]
MARDLDTQVTVAKRRDRIATGVLTAIVALIFVLLAAIIIYIIVRGFGKAFDPSFLTSPPEQFRSGGGVGPEIFNSFYLLVLTLLISTPLSLGAAIFLVEYAPDNAATHAVKTIIEVLSSLPSIVVGLFGFLLFVINFGWGFSILSGALALTIFNIPIMVRVIQQALEAVPPDIRDAGLALGLTHWETVRHIVIPTAMPAIITGIILSAGRVFGEAAALIYTAGQSAPALDFTSLDFSSYSCPWNVWRPAETLAVHIWKINSEGVIPDLTDVSNGTAAILLICILIFNLLARWAGKRLGKKMMAE